MHKIAQHLKKAGSQIPSRSLIHSSIMALDELEKKSKKDSRYMPKDLQRPIAKALKNLSDFAKAHEQLLNL